MDIWLIFILDLCVGSSLVHDLSAFIYLESYLIIFLEISSNKLTTQNQS